MSIEKTLKRERELYDKAVKTGCLVSFGHWLSRKLWYANKRNSKLINCLKSFDPTKDSPAGKLIAEIEARK